MTTVSGARKTICCCRCATIATRWTEKAENKRQLHHEGRLSGILNGVDDGIWSPQNDLLLPMRYDRDTLDGEGGEQASAAS
ncbi:hypothetical protein C7D74_23005 [Klebsiella pneumoniae]|nr:hypothetical protein C7D74_23005 [Klebsiella pneumoniae]